MSPSLNTLLSDPFSTIPRYPLLYPFNSPIHPLQSLSSTTTNNNTSSNPEPRRIHLALFAKREDHSSPLACAGNKYRKLEYLIPDILSPSPKYGSGAASDLPAELGPGSEGKGKGRVTTLVTEGAVQSNHTVQVTSVAKKLGLESVVLLHKGIGRGLSVSGDQGAFLRGGNVQVNRLLGADVRILESPSHPNSDTMAVMKPKTEEDLVEEVLDSLKIEGKRPYWIPSGASLHPLGGLGYARCGFEIASQETDLLPKDVDERGDSGPQRFDYIFVACGSGSTLGGLLAGFKLLEKTQEQLQEQNRKRRRPRQIIGILISPTKPKEYHEERILRFARRAGEMIGLDAEKDITMDDVRLDDRFVGSAYGVLDAQTKETLAMVAQKEEVMLDPVYTAKVVRGMMHWVDEGEIAAEIAAANPGQKQANALFIHTGGQSALGAYADV